MQRYILLCEGERERQIDRDGDNSIRDKMPASMCADKQQMPGRQSIAAAAATAAGCGSREATRKEAEKAQGRRQMRYREVEQ